MARFEFRQFAIDDNGCGMKICSDSVLLGAWFAASYPEASSAADIGAGSGVLALMVAQLCPHVTITALELDEGAARAASMNFAASPFADRLRLQQGNFADYVPASPFDLIISNPPYFTTGEQAADKARAAARHQAGLSYASLMNTCSRWLASDGHIGLVSPAEFENDIIFEAELAGLKLRRLLRVRTSPRKQPTRLLWDFSPTDGPLLEACLDMRGRDGLPTAEYTRIVDSFYTKI